MKPLVSVVINNFNYARFLRAATDSALAQSYPRVEVIVVDDGSTDESREIIASYGGRVISVLKDNGGQASAINAGFARSRGEYIVFLDSDDTLMPEAAAAIVNAFAETAAVKAHWYLRVVDEDGRPNGAMRPSGPLARGDLRCVLERDSLDHACPPQSGNAYARAFLEAALPIDEPVYRTGGADTLLSMLSIVGGTVAAIDAPLGMYRMHHASHWSSRDLQARLRLGYDRFAHTCAELAKWCEARGLPAQPARWLAHSWFGRSVEAIGWIVETVPAGGSFILIDDDTLGVGASLEGRRCLPMTEKDGTYNGPPGSGIDGVQELMRLARMGASHVVIAWPSFWWLEQYRELAAYLAEGFGCIRRDEVLIAYDLHIALLC